MQAGTFTRRRARRARRRWRRLMKDVDKLDIRDVAGGAAIAVKAVAGSSRERVVGVLGNCLKVTGAAAPAKGKAHAAIAHILAKARGVGRRDVGLLAGQTRPRKEFVIVGLSAEQVKSRLAAAGKGQG